MSGLGYGRQIGVVVTVVALVAGLTARVVAAEDPVVEAMKARLSSTSTGDKPHLCVQIAEHQLAQADKLYATGEVEKAQAALTDVEAYSELARDYAIQSHKYQKQAEIAVRVMTRKLTELMHSLGHDEQTPVQDAIGRLQRVRDDLLASMFKKGAK